MPAPRASSVVPDADRSSRLRGACESMMFAAIRAARAEAAEEDLSLPQLFLLGAIDRAGFAPVTRLTSFTGATPATISGILDGLEELGLLRRTHGTEDRRQVLVSLSPRGHRLVARLEARRRRRWNAIDRGLGVRERDVAARVLGRVQAALMEGLRELPSAPTAFGRPGLRVAT